MRIRTTSAGRRPAFTLVEMLVVAAMSGVIMVILTQAFRTGLDATSKLRGIGEMQERLRATASVMKRDLATPHFGGNFTDEIDGPYLTDQRLDDPLWEPPDQGFFRIIQGSTRQFSPGTPYYQEGIDGDGLPVNIATDHSLHFTVSLRGLRHSELFSSELTDTPPSPPIPPVVTTAADFAAVFSPRAFYVPSGPPNTNRNYMSEWAEVAYFLTPVFDVTGTQQEFTTRADGTPGLPLYTLRRRQRLALPMDWQQDLNDANGGLPVVVPTPPGQPTASPFWEEVSRYASASGGLEEANTPADLTVPDRRLATAIAPTALGPLTTYPVLSDFNGNWIYDPGTDGPYSGDDVLLGDVISFEVRVTGVPKYGTGPGELLPPTTVAEVWPRPESGGNPDYLFDDLPDPARIPDGNPTFGPGVRVFDTWSRYDDPLGTSRYTYSLWNDPAGTGTRFRIPMRIRITSMQIRIRTWDRKRQAPGHVTIVQDL